ncbi:hypothetical protein H2O64_18500 [Kordia sp. YSTF-M3]|uniref:Uncharacterized protein n=1 Tax=Kordia aestuariivivens TaxID=2759037 RepID=A0ABR7QDM4_9FLAO|nr:hypothetical protein [Kordia aestuariivivens]MBC8756670.1 hypothetical protein [Kordia aestuariivivens]
MVLKKQNFIDTQPEKPFEDVLNKSFFPLMQKLDFEEIPSEKNSVFYENRCGEFSENFNIGKTDFDQLATDLKNNLNDPKFIFNWSKYTSQRFTQSRYRVSVKDIYLDRDVKGLPKYVKTRHDIPFKYNLDGEEKSGYFEEARFNKRICSLNPEPQYSININIKKLEASFKIFLFYKNDREKGFNLSNYDPDNDKTFDVPSKYIAIRLTSKKATDFLAFWELIKGTPLSKSTLKAEFKELYSKNTTDEQLDWLYSITPISLIKEKSLQELWKDTIRLLKYDTDRYFTDNSSNQIKVLEAIADKKGDKISGMQFLYNKFEDNPKIIKDIYTALDGIGTSQYTLGFTVPNKTIFASLLRALCNYKGQGFHRYKKFITFKNTKGYQVNSANELTRKDISNVINDIYDAIFDTNDETSYVNEERIALVQEEEEYVENSGSFEPLPSSYVHYLHPLDFVNFVIEDTDGKETTFQVPAIFLKDQAFQRNLKDLIKVIRVGLDILVVVVSAHTLAQGTTPLLTAISIIDLGLATGDIAIQAFEEQIRKIEGPNGEPWGADFLDTWEHIYIIGGFVTGVPLLVPLMGNMLISGGKLLLKITGKARDQLIKILKYGIERLKNFPKFIGGKFTIITDFAKKFGNSKFTYQLKELYNEGAILTKGIIEGETISKYYLLFREEIISFGNIKEIIKDVTAIGKIKGAKLLDKLLEYVSFLRKRRTLVNTAAKIGEEATEESIKWGTVKMKLHPRYEQILSFLKENKIRIIELDTDTFLKVGAGYRVRYVFGPKGKKFLRIEKEIEWHPEMRFLDLEHEIDHVLQFEKNLNNKSVTVVSKEVNGKTIDISLNKQILLGRLSDRKMIFLEAEVRIREVERLKTSNVPQNILKEHEDALNNFWLPKTKKAIVDNKKLLIWVKEKFPDFDLNIITK